MVVSFHSIQSQTAKHLQAHINFIKPLCNYTQGCVSSNSGLDLVSLSVCSRCCLVTLAVEMMPAGQVVPRSNGCRQRQESSCKQLSHKL